MTFNRSEGGVTTETEAMEVEPAAGGTTAAGDDYDEVMNDPAFLQSVLETLPGVDPSSDAVQSAVVALRNQEKDKKADASKKPDAKWGHWYSSILLQHAGGRRKPQRLFVAMSTRDIGSVFGGTGISDERIRSSLA